MVNLLLHFFSSDVVVAFEIILSSKEASHLTRDAPVCLSCGIEYVMRLLCTILIRQDSLVYLPDDWWTTRFWTIQVNCLGWLHHRVILRSYRLWLLLVLRLKFYVCWIMLRFDWSLSWNIFSCTVQLVKESNVVFCFIFMEHSWVHVGIWAHLIFQWTLTSDILRLRFRCFCNLELRY